MPFPFSDPVASIFFWVSCGAWSLLEWGLILRDWRAGVKASTPADRGSLRLTVTTVCVGAFLAFGAALWLPALRITASGWALLVIGLTLVWLGMGLRLWAVLTLGRSFTRVVMVQSGQQVVSSGPYRAVRHPAYTGILTTMLGIGLALNNRASVVALVLIPLMGFAWRIHVEENALVQNLGEDYTAYAQRTRRLIPGLW